MFARGLVLKSIFVYCGRHAPNADSVHLLSRTIWPQLRAAFRARHPAMPVSALPEMHVYGAYPDTTSAAQFDQPSEGFRVFGPIGNHLKKLSQYRALLAPLRFGAGVKGKIADAWLAGLPVVTTPIGAEGMYLADLDSIPMHAHAHVHRNTNTPGGRGGGDLFRCAAAACHGHGGAGPMPATPSLPPSPHAGPSRLKSSSSWSPLPFAGHVASLDTPGAFVRAALDVYTNAEVWAQTQARGFHALQGLCCASVVGPPLMASLAHAFTDRVRRRHRDTIGAAFWTPDTLAPAALSRHLEAKAARTLTQAPL